MLIGTTDLPLYTILITLTLAGVTRSVQSKISRLHFLEHFSTDQHETSCGVEAIQTEHPDTLFESLFQHGEITAVLLTQGYHWTFAKITENLRVHAVSQKMNTKRDKVQKEKDEIGENRENGKRIGGERIEPKIREITENRHPC